MEKKKRETSLRRISHGRFSNHAHVADLAYVSRGIRSSDSLPPPLPTADSRLCIRTNQRRKVRYRNRKGLIARVIEKLIRCNCACENYYIRYIIRYTVIIVRVSAPRKSFSNAPICRACIRKIPPATINTDLAERRAIHSNHEPAVASGGIHPQQRHNGRVSRAAGISA